MGLFFTHSQTHGKMPGVSVKDVNQADFVKALAAFLKKSGKLKVPDWTDLVKSGNYKELAPYEDDWYYIRAASMPDICTSGPQLVSELSQGFTEDAKTTALPPATSPQAPDL